MESVDYFLAKYPEIGLLILGDFKRMDISQIIRGNDLYQMVDFPTRAGPTVRRTRQLKDHLSESIFVFTRLFILRSCISRVYVYLPTNILSGGTNAIKSEEETKSISLVTHRLQARSLDLSQSLESTPLVLGFRV